MSGQGPTVNVKSASLLLILLGLGAWATAAGQEASLPGQGLPAEGSCPAEPAVRGAVVRVEVALDPFSLGPALAEELAARQPASPGRLDSKPWTSYEQELARRLRVGATGSGFFVNQDGYLVTNAHALLTGIRFRGLHFTPQEWDSMRRLLETVRDVWVTVESRGGDASPSSSPPYTYLAEVVAVAEDLDLAVLRARVPPGNETVFPFLPIAPPDQLRVGERVMALGFPEDEFRISEGQVLSLVTGAEVHDDLKLIRRSDPRTGEESVLVSGTSAGPVGRFQHSAPTGHGNSGGPIMDGQGRVVGVAYALLADEMGQQQPDLNLAITAGVLRRFLSQHGVAFAETSGQGPGPRGQGPGVAVGGQGARLSSDGDTLAPGTQEPRAPLLQANGGEAWAERVAHDPYDYEAHRQLMGQHRRDGSYEAAYYQAAWLAWLGPASFGGSGEAAAYLRDRRARDRAASNPAAPARTVVAAVDAQRWVCDCCFNGAIAQQTSRLAGEVSDLIGDLDRTLDRAQGDPVARMAMAHLYLTLDDLLALGNSPESRRARSQTLRTAASQAASVCAALPKAPGAHRTLATIRARLAELDGRDETWELAIRECEEAYRLDPQDPSLAEMLWVLTLRAGRWEEARKWEARVEQSNRADRE